MNTTQHAEQFLQHWVDTCDQRKNILIRDWANTPVFTSHVLTEPNSVIKTIADRLHLTSYVNYYSLDAILFEDPGDLVPNRPVGTTWVRRIRIAFEHENYFKSGLFQEVSHLLITNCDLRVVVSYPDDCEELHRELEHLHSIIAETDRADQIAANGAFLFIAGLYHDKTGRIEWIGHAYDRTEWRKL